MNRRYRLPAELNRRHFIAALSVAMLGAVGLTRCNLGGQQQVAAAAAPAAAPERAPG